jgi:hypothetical protein
MSAGYQGRGAEFRADHRNRLVVAGKGYRRRAPRAVERELVGPGVNYIRGERPGPPGRFARGYRVTTLVNGSPRANLPTLAATSSARPRNVSAVTPDECGVISTLANW